MRSWRRRAVARRPYLRPPATPPLERLEAARQAARAAEETLARVQELEPAVEANAEKAERIHRENNLGPSVWRVMEGGKA